MLIYNPNFTLDVPSISFEPGHSRSMVTQPLIDDSAVLPRSSCRWDYSFDNLKEVVFRTNNDAIHEAALYPGLQLNTVTWRHSIVLLSKEFSTSNLDTKCCCLPQFPILRMAGA